MDNNEKTIKTQIKMCDKCIASILNKGGTFVYGGVELNINEVEVIKVDEDECENYF